jgi:putative phosphoribosyl transferase
MPSRPHPPLFDDRADAGRQLARALEGVASPPLVVAGLARGGVEVAAEVAAALNAPLEALAVRKIGHPLNPELALGAVTASGETDLEESVRLGPRGRGAVLRAAERAAGEALELEDRLNAGRTPRSVSGVSCVLVDDGLATGSSMRAAVRAARAAGAARVIVAVPVAAPEGMLSLAIDADDVRCPYVIDDFTAVGVWYRDFGQVSEERVRELLAQADRRVGS